MILRRALLWLIIPLLTASAGAMGTIAQPNFRHYTIQEGLSVNAVYSIAQDSKGFLWFGTIDGLNRFDGRSIKTYRLTPGDEQADIRLGNIIYALCEDAEQQLWIASDRGVARFDLRTERFLPFALNRAGPVRTPDQRASAVATDAEGRVWMALFGQGLFCYTPKTGATKQFLHNPNDPHSLASNNIRRLYFDASGTLWLSYTDVGIARNSNRLLTLVNQLMDFRKIEADGFLLKNERQELATSHIPLILLTARAHIDAKIEGLETGADVYIEKPFSVDFLCAQINSLLLNRAKLRQQFVDQPLVRSATIATSRADKELLARMDAVIEKNLAESEFSVEDLAGELCMSRSTLFEKIKSVSGLTPNNYIRLARLKKAAEYLSGGEYMINEVCYLVGFSSSSYFTKCFKKQFGMLPTEFVER